MCTLSLPSVLDVGGWSTPRPTDLSPGKRPATHCTGCWVRRSGLVRKISPPTGFDPPTVRLLAGHYTDYAIMAGAAWLG